MAKKKQKPEPKPKTKSKPKGKTVADKNPKQNPPQQPQPQNPQNPPQQSRGQNPPNVAGGPADDTSVRTLADKCAEFASAAMSGNWGHALKTGAGVLTVLGDLFGLPNIFGAEEGASADDEAALDEAKKSLEECKAKASAPRAEEGTEKVAGAAPKPKDMDLASIMMLVDVFLKLLEQLRKPKA